MWFCSTYTRATTEVDQHFNFCTTTNLLIVYNSNQNYIKSFNNTKFITKSEFNTKAYFIVLL